MPVFANLKLSQINYSFLKSYRIALLDQKLKNNTINGIFQTLNFIFKFAYLDNKILKNPLQGFGALPKTSPRDSFRRHELISIIQRTPPVYRDFALLLALTGMRVSECYGIRESDLFCNNSIHYIDLNKQLLGAGYAPLKTKNSRRIPLTEKALYLCHEQKFSLSTLNHKISALFQSCENVKERQLCMHSIRHFFITDTKSKGINPLIVETIAGHSLTGMEGVYTNFHEEDLSQIIQWQEALLKELDLKD